MLRCLPFVVLFLGSCNFGQPQSRGASVTVTLPPPKVVPAPGFSSSIAPEAGDSLQG